MAVDPSVKKVNWLARFVAAAIAAVDAIDSAAKVAGEYTTDAFDGGDLANRPEFRITDADLAGQSAFKHLDAAKLNQLVGALNAVKATKDANAGYLEAARP